jgi:hypothetical protein
MHLMLTDFEHARHVFHDGPAGVDKNDMHTPNCCWRPPRAVTARRCPEILANIDAHLLVSAAPVKPDHAIRGR